jgi:CMP-N-acetylneuraminic acid synthetase
MDPLLHMIEWLAQHEAYRPEIVVVLQPTSPLRSAADIDDAIALMTTTGVPSIVSVTSIGAPAAWLRTVTANRRLTRPVMADDDLYVLNGAIYAARTEVILATRQMDDGAPAAYVMPRERSIDIDTAADLRLAEALLGQGE